MKAGKRRKKWTNQFFDVPFFILLAIAVSGGLTVLLLNGSTVFTEVLIADAELFLRILILIGAGILLGGFVQVLIPADLIARWLGTKSGVRGILIATAGAITPGGPLVSFPLVLALRAAGADAAALVAYLTAWSTIALNRMIIWEIPFMGVEFTLIRVASSIFLPILVGLTIRRFSDAGWKLLNGTGLDK